jgi:hypothetical protein
MRRYQFSSLWLLLILLLFGGAPSASFRLCTVWGAEGTDDTGSTLTSTNRDAVASAFRSANCEGVYPGHLQGICTDECDAIYWSWTDTLVKTDARGRVLKQVKVAKHHGDLCFYDRKVFVAVNLGQFNLPAGHADSWVFVYDADTLGELARHRVPQVVHGAGGIGYHEGRFIVVGGLPAGVQENYLYEYDERFTFQQRHVLTSGYTLMGIQTAAYAEGAWWFGCYGVPSVLLRADSSLGLTGRWQFDAALGIVGAGNGRFLIGQNNVARGGGYQGQVVLARLAGEKGLVLDREGQASPAPANPSSADVTSWAAPPEEALSEHYELTVNGQAVPVLACRVSAMPFNQVWPGYQRPLDQTELAGFACWDMAGPVRVVVQSRRAVQSVVVRPASLGIRPSIGEDRISFTLERPGSVILEVNGSHHALHLFASPPEKNLPAPDAPGVRFFSPGVHRVGKINLQSNETVYIAGGAVVYGSLSANGASNIRIAGRGVLDGSAFPRGEGGGAVRLVDCSDVRVEGIVMRDPDVWCCSLFGCRNVRIANVKLVGLWRYNADGIDVCNSQGVEVSDCFVRAFDDALVVKGLKSGGDPSRERPVKNVGFRRCVVWCDWGRAMEIGAETCAPEIAGIVFQDCDIVRTTHVAMDIQHGDRAAIHDVRFENVRFELDDRNPQPRMQTSREEKYPAAPDKGYCPKLMEIVIYKTPYSNDAERGTVRDVIFRDIAVTGPHMPPSSFRGFDAEHGVDGVTIANMRLNGRAITNAPEARLQIGPFVRPVQFGGADAPAQ